MKDAKLENEKLIQFGERVKKYRQKKRLTQEALAECMDVSNTYISQIERGIHSPSLPVFVDLCRYLDVDASILLKDFLDTECSEEKQSYRTLCNLCSQLNDQQLDGLIHIVKIFLQTNSSSK